MKLRETIGRHREAVDRQLNLDQHLIVYLLWVLLISAIALSFANYSMKLQTPSVSTSRHMAQTVMIKAI